MVLPFFSWKNSTLSLPASESAQPTIPPTIIEAPRTANSSNHCSITQCNGTIFILYMMLISL